MQPLLEDNCFGCEYNEYPDDYYTPCNNCKDCDKYELSDNMKDVLEKIRREERAKNIEIVQNSKTREHALFMLKEIGDNELD